MRSTRREALTVLGVTAAAATLGGITTLAGAQALGPQADTTGAKKPRKPKKSRDKANAVADVSLRELRGLTFGTCVVTEVAAAEHGAIPVTMTDPKGTSFTVDVLRHDQATPGVARAGSLAVYMQSRTGHQPTNEEHGLAAMALAAALGQREAAGAPVPALLTLNERAQVRASWNRRETLARNA